MNSDKTVIFFTGTFPCGRGETFIEAELPYLAAAFKNVIIVTNNMAEPVTRPVTTNTKVVRYPYSPSMAGKLFSPLGWLSAAARHEIKFIKQTLQQQVSWGRAKIFLATLAKAKETAAFITQLLRQEHLTPGNVCLYSYWLNDMATAIAWYKQRHPQVKAVCRAHRWDIYLEGHPEDYLPLRGFTLQNLNACYSISQDGINYLDSLTNRQYTPKLQLARLGTLNPYSPATGETTGKVAIVSCSHIIERKRINLVIDALAALNNTMVEWIHFGDGPQQAEMEEYARAQLQPRGIAYQFAGAISNSNLLQFYSSAAIGLFINTSSSEGVPVSIMEAFSFGIPAIATNVGGSHEIIEDGENGYLLKVTDEGAAIAATINKYIALDAADRQRMRQSARRQWSNKYDAHKNYTAFTQLLAAER